MHKANRMPSLSRNLKKNIAKIIRFSAKPHIFYFLQYLEKCWLRSKNIEFEEKKCDFFKNGYQDSNIHNFVEFFFLNRKYMCHLIDTDAVYKKMVDIFCEVLQYVNQY